MATERFNTGALVFGEGDRSECAYVVEKGQVEIRKKAEEGDIQLGLLGPGEIFGEMGLVDEAPRSASAIAKDNVEVRVLDRDAFLDLIRTDPDQCLSFIHVLFERLRRANAHAALKDLFDEEPEPPRQRQLYMQLIPLTHRAKFRMPDGGITVNKLPFTVGRHSNHPLDINDLEVDDERPYHVSRSHLVIERMDGHLLARDRGSYLGSIINGQNIGGLWKDKAARLHMGSNDLVFGEADSPFRYRLEVDEA